MKLLRTFSVLVAAFFAVLFSQIAVTASNSNPGLFYGQIPSPAQWNSYFSTKLDYLPGSANTIPYWDASGNMVSASVTGDCSSALNVFTCHTLQGFSFASPPPSGIGSSTAVPGFFTTLNVTGLTGVTTLNVTSLTTGSETVTGNSAINGTLNASAVNATTFTAGSENVTGNSTINGTMSASAVVATNNLTVNGTAITANSATVTASAVTATANVNTPSLNGNQLGGYRNRIINSGFPVSQVNGNTAVTITAGAALQYVIDQFYAYSTGANVTGQRIAGTSQDQYKYQFTGAASVTSIGFAQRMESLRTYSLNGTTATFSVEMKNSLLTTATWTAYYANTADTFGTLAAPTHTQIATGTCPMTATESICSAQIAIPSAATTGIEIVLTVGAQTSGTWTIGEMQLEPGTVATTFEEVNYDDQLRWCQRFLPVFNSTGTSSNLGPAYSNATNSAFITISFPVPTRVAVTGLVVSNATHLTFNSNAGFAFSTFTFGSASNIAANAGGTATGATALAGGTVIFNNASGQLYFTGAQL